MLKRKKATRVKTPDDLREELAARIYKSVEDYHAAAKAGRPDSEVAEMVREFTSAVVRRTVAKWQFVCLDPTLKIPPIEGAKLVDVVSLLEGSAVGFVLDGTTYFEASCYVEVSESYEPRYIVQVGARDLDDAASRRLVKISGEVGHWVDADCSLLHQLEKTAGN